MGEWAQIERMKEPLPGYELIQAGVNRRMMIKSRPRLSAGCYSRPDSLSTLGLEAIGGVIVSGGEAGARDRTRFDSTQVAGEIKFNAYAFPISRSAG